MRTVRKLAAAAAAAAVLWAGGAMAAWPEKAVNYIIPFNPGGESDIAARMQQPYFKEITGKDLVVQYQAGAGGAAAWSQLNSMQGDGYTVMGTNFPHIILQPLQDKDVGYATDDITNVYVFQYTPDALIVPAGSPYQTVEDFVNAAKESPGGVTLSGSGTFSGNHLAQQRFDKLAGIQTTYIPMAGTGPSVTALLGGQVQGAWGYTTVGVQQGDQVRLLAVAMDERHPQFPDVPTFKELDYDISSGVHRGIAVPASTPEDLRTQISDAFDQVNQAPEFREKMTNEGFVVVDVPYAEVPGFIKEQTEQYEELAREVGMVEAQQ